MNEKEMREAKVPTLNTEEELIAYVRSLVEQEHDYGTCVYAMSMAATAAFEFVASKLGVTGFQASCADLDVIRRLRGWEGPFTVCNMENCLYPQYDLIGDLRKSIEKSGQWLGDEARKLIASNVGKSHVHPNVLRHWKMLDKKYPAKTEAESGVMP